MEPGGWSLESSSTHSLSPQEEQLSRFLRKINQQHVRQPHQDSWLLSIGAVLSEDKIIRDIDAGVDSVILLVEQGDEVAERRTVRDGFVVGLEYLTAIGAIEEVRVGRFVEKIHRGEQAILHRDRWIGPGLGIGIKPQPGERRQQIGNIQRPAAREFCQSGQNGATSFSRPPRPQYFASASTSESGAMSNRRRKVGTA